MRGGLFVENQEDDVIFDETGDVDVISLPTCCFHKYSMRDIAILWSFMKRNVDAFYYSRLLYVCDSAIAVKLLTSSHPKCAHASKCLMDLYYWKLRYDLDVMASTYREIGCQGGVVQE